MYIGYACVGIDISLTPVVSFSFTSISETIFLMRYRTTILNMPEKIVE